MNSIRPGVVLSVFVSASLITSLACAADLIVRIGGVQSAASNVRVGLFGVAADFPKKQLRGASVVAKESVVTAVFKDVPAGTYAISAFQDLNANGKLDTNSFGKPNEPYGFSRNARGTFGPPAFAEAAFSVREGANTVRFDLK